MLPNQPWHTNDKTLYPDVRDVNGEGGLFASLNRWNTVPGLEPGLQTRETAHLASMNSQSAGETNAEKSVMSVTWGLEEDRCLLQENDSAPEVWWGLP